MKNKLLKVSVIALAIILLLQVGVFAVVDQLTVKALTDKDTYEVGDKVTVTVDWTEGMQAAVFKLKYDASKLTFNSASIKSSYYNADTEGVVSVNWASLEEEDYTKMTFEFTAKAEGKTTILVEEPKFATGNLEEPASYSTQSKEITINAKVLGDSGNNQQGIGGVDTGNGTGTPVTPAQKDATTAKGKMPQTGIEDAIVMVIGVVAVLGVVGFIKYRRLSDI